MKLLKFLLHVFIICFFTLLISCLVPPAPNFFEYKIIEENTNSKDFIIKPVFGYEFIATKENFSYISIRNISNEKKNLKKISYSINSTYKLCFDSLIVTKSTMPRPPLGYLNDSTIPANMIIINPKETINLRMVCSKNQIDKSIHDTVNISIEVNNDFFYYKLKRIVDN